jgi:hypothetical protein
MLNDQTTGQGGCAVGTTFSGTTLEVISPIDIHANDRFNLNIPYVTTPSTGTQFHGFTLRTSSSSAVAPPASICPANCFVAPEVIAGLTTTFSSLAGGVGNAEWTQRFTLPSSGGLSSGVGQLIVNAPSGTTFPYTYGYGGYCYGGTQVSVTDETTGHTGCASSSPNGAIDFITAPFNLLGGDVIYVQIYEVNNPPPQGSVNESVSSSASTVSSAAPMTFVAPVAVTALTLKATSLAGGAQDVGYNINFTLGSQGTLIGNSGAAIVLGVPSGTSFTPNCSANTIIDFTTNQTQAFACPSVTSTAAVFMAPFTMFPGDRIGLFVDVNNPPTGTALNRVTVNTTSNTVPLHVGTSAGVMLAPVAVSGFTFTPSSGVGGAASVTWAMNFHTSAQGFLSHQTQAGMLVEAPSGTVFSTNPCDYVINDATTGRQDGCPQIVVIGSTVHIQMVEDIGANNDVTLSVNNVKNPLSTTPFSGVVFSDTSDTVTTHVSSGAFS